jgi:hypothetical protein
MIHIKLFLKIHNIWVSPYFEVIMSQHGGYPQSVAGVLFASLPGWISQDSGWLQAVTCVLFTSLP